MHGKPRHFLEIKAILETTAEKLYGAWVLIDTEHVMYASIKVVDSKGNELFACPDFVGYSELWDKRNEPEKMLRDWEATYQQLQLARQ